MDRGYNCRVNPNAICSRIEPMVRQSKNEGDDANCKATACPAKDPEEPPYELTASEKEALAKFQAASEIRGPQS